MNKATMKKWTREKLEVKYIKLWMKAREFHDRAVVAEHDVNVLEKDRDEFIACCDRYHRELKTTSETKAKVECDLSDALSRIGEASIKLEVMSAKAEAYREVALAGAKR